MKICLAAGTLWLTGIVFGQTRVDLRTQSKTVDFSAASSTKPVKTGTTPPGACSIGELFFKTDATGGKNLYLCGQTDYWTEMAGVSSGCGLKGCELGQCSVDSSVIPSYSGMLSTGYILVGGGGSTIRALPPGASGQVLRSNGTSADPQWSDATSGAGVTSHAALTGLDYASSGHTGFQAALEFTPESAANKGQPNGYAALDANGKVPDSAIPSRAVASYQQYVAAKCQSGVAAPSFSLPDTNAPTAVCVSGNGLLNGLLQFANNTNNQSIQDHFELPPDWTGAIDVEIAGKSGDSTHVTTLSVQTVCVSGGDVATAAFNTAQTFTITAAASGGRTSASLNNVTASGCSPGNEFYFKIMADTTALSSPNTFDLMSIRWTVRRTL